MSLVERLRAEAARLRQQYGEGYAVAQSLLLEAAKELQYLGEERRTVEREVRGSPADFR